MIFNQIILFYLETSNEFIFVNKEESRFWLSLFIKNFLAVNSRRGEDEDDLLFFIRKKPTKFLQQYEVEFVSYFKSYLNMTDTIDIKYKKIERSINIKYNVNTIRNHL